MTKKDMNDDLRPYRIGPFTVLQLMAVFIVLGLLVTWILHRFWG